MKNLCMTNLNRQPAASRLPEQCTSQTSPTGRCQPAPATTRPHILLRSLALTVTLMLAALLPCRAGVAYTWTGVSTPSWVDNSSWSPNTGFPGAGDTAIFPSGLTVAHSYSSLSSAQTVDSLTFNIDQFFTLGSGGGGSLSLGNSSGSSITQNGSSTAVLFPNVTCTSPCTLDGTGAGTVNINGNLLGSPALIVNSATYNIGTGNTGGGLALQSITVNGGMLNIGTSNNVNVAGAVVVNNGGTLRLCNPGVSSATFNAASLTVATGGTLYGNATVNSTTPTFFALGSFINPGCSPSTLTFVGGLTLSSGTSLTFELDNPGVVGGGVNDLMDVTGDLNLAGTLNVTAYPNFGVGTYRLFNYTGTLTGSGLVFGSLPAGYSYSIDTATYGQVNLLVTTPPPVSVNLVHGYNFIVNPVNGTGGNNANNASFLQGFTSDPNGVLNTVLYVWNCTGFNIYQYFTGADADAYFANVGSVSGWYDAVGNLVNNLIWNSGQGMILYNPGSSTTLTFFGTLPTTTATLPCGCGHFNLLGSATNVPGTYENVTGLSPTTGAQVLRYIPGMPISPVQPPNYDVYNFTGGSWTPSAPLLNNGEAAWFLVPCYTNPCTSTNLVVKTGTDANGGLLTAGSPEQIFQTLGSPVGTNTMVTINMGAIPGVWSQANGVSQWVGPNANPNGPVGWYTNRWTFWLPCPNALLTGRISTDDEGYLFINGVDVSPAGGFGFGFAGISHNTGFVAGWNTVDIVVHNGGGPTGFRAELTNTFSSCCCSNPATISCPTNKTVNCGTAWSFNPPVITQLGGGSNYTVTVTTSTNGSCPVQITRQWLITDACGNTNTCSQIVTVNYPAPTLSNPGNKSVPCTSSWSFNPPVLPNNGCSNTLTVLSTVTNGLCPKTVMRTWLAASPCGASNVYSQTVTLIDTTPPVINCSNNKNVPCGAAWTFNTPTASDACSGTNVTITVFSSATNGTSCARTYTRTWVATDACGNSNTCSQTVTVLDSTPPVINCTTNKSVNCGAPIVFDTPFVSDACNSFTLTFTTVTNGPCPKTYKRTWLATDACGNTNTCSQTITAVDTNGPVITLPLLFSQYHTCNTSLVVNFKVTATDACSGNVTPVCFPPSGYNFPVGTTTVTCTATDLCGNVTTNTFKITVVNDSKRDNAMAGIDDLCSNPASETAPKSKALKDAHLGAVWKDFDVKAQNRPFGLSFTSLPKHLTCATLEIKMAPYKKTFSLYKPDNDTITLSTPGGSSWFAHIGTGFGSPKLLNETWRNQDKCGRVFTLDLASLPTGISLLTDMGNKQELDIFIEDCTTVDYAKLSYCYCPDSLPPFGGWNGDLANATATFTDHFTLVKPVDPLTNYSATLTPGAMRGAQVGLDSLNLGSTPNASFSVSATYNGQLNLINDPLIEWIVAMKGDGNGKVGVSLPALSPNITQIKLILSLNGVAVKETTLPAASGTNAIVIMEDGPMLRALTAQDDRILDAQDDRFTLSLEAAHNIRDCPLCPPTLADQVTMVLVNPARSSDDTLTSLKLTANGLNEFSVGDTAVKIGDGWAQVTGDGTASVSGDQLTVNANDSSSTNEIGIIVQLPVANATSFNLATFQDSPATQSNGILHVEAFGIGSSGQDGVSVTQTRFTQTNGGWDIATSFSALGSSQELYQVYNHGVQVASFTFHGTPHVPVLPATMSAADSGTKWIYEWASDGIVSINGVNYPGNELRVSAVAPTLLPIGINRINIGSSGQDGVSISGPTIPAPYWWMLPLAIEDDGLSVQWTGPAGGALESSPTVSGPWTVVPNQNSRSAVTPSPESPNAAPAQFFRVRSN